MKKDGENRIEAADVIEAAKTLASAGARLGAEMSVQEVRIIFADNRPVGAQASYLGEFNALIFQKLFPQFRMVDYANSERSEFGGQEHPGCIWMEFVGEEVEDPHQGVIDGPEGQWQR